MVTKPAWLKDLLAADRQLAEQLLRQAGDEARFMRIAKVATAVKRPPFRPTRDNTAAHRHAILFWFTHRGLTEIHAITLAAKDLQKKAANREITVDGLDYDRFRAMTLQAVKRITREALGGDSLKVGHVLSAEKEARALGLLARQDLPESQLARNLSAMGIAFDTSRLTAGTSKFAVTGQKMHPTAAMKKMQRLGHLAQALQGYLDPAAPASDLAPMLDNLIERIRSI